MYSYKYERRTNNQTLRDAISSRTRQNQTVTYIHT